jgi:hypothetical protein
LGPQCQALAVPATFPVDDFVLCKTHIREKQPSIAAGGENGRLDEAGPTRRNMASFRHARSGESHPFRHFDAAYWESCGFIRALLSIAFL